MTRIRKKSFTVRMVKQWNRLPRVEVGATSLGVSKVSLDRILSNPVHWKMPVLTARGLG